MNYKLIKRYPGYNNVGRITWFGPNNLVHPENYPEFWEEVIEKDYEILSFINQNKSVCKVNDTNYLESYILANLHIFKIHSIKRLSDSEIFTIGDKVFSEYVNYTINKIGIVNDKCMVSVLYDINNSNSSRLHYNLNNLKKVKQKLFTSEDGVDIFKDDTIYEIFPTFTIYETKWYNYYGKNGKPLKNKIYFSTKEKAEEYILMNKPCLSLNDIENAMDQTSYLISSKLNKFRDYLKSKIQQSV